jgi:hypothetical protein
VQQCYRKEGVNHYQNCREVRPTVARRSAAPGALTSPPAAAVGRPAQHVNAYLECVKDVGISRINWTNMS